MTVFQMGGELDSFFPLSTNVLEVTTAGTFDPVYARCAIGVAAVNVGAATDILRSPDLPDPTNIWHHFDGWHNASGAQANFIVYYNSLLVPVFRLNKAGNSISDIQPQQWDGATWQNVGNSFVFSIGTLTQFDINIVCGIGGNFTIKRQGIVVSTGNFILPVIDNIRRIEYRATANIAAQNLRISQHVVADFDLTNYKLYTKPPTANGANTAWVGTFADVDETVTSDLDFISSGAVDQIETFTGAAIAIPSGTIAAVAVNGRVTANPGGPQSVRGVLRIGGTNYFNPVTDTLGTGWRPYDGIFELNPATGLPFTISEAGAASLEFGLQSRT